MAQSSQDLERLYVAPLQMGTDPINPDLFEALRARIEEGFAATGAYTIETRLGVEADAIINELDYVQRAASKSVDWIIFGVVDSITCIREARPITRVPGKYNNKAKCDAIMRVRVVSPKNDELETSYELDETLEKSLGVVDEIEVLGTRFPNGSYRAPITVNAESREFVELAQQLSASLVSIVYEGQNTPEVMQVAGNQIFISRGERGGFNVGDVLMLQQPTGQILYHPVSGKKLDEVTIPLGKVIITRSLREYSVAEPMDPSMTVEAGARAIKTSG